MNVHFTEATIWCAVSFIFTVLDFFVFHRSAQWQLKFTDIQTSIKDERKTVAKLGDWKRALERQEAEVQRRGGVEGVSYVTFSISGAQSPQQFTFPNYRYGPPRFILAHEWYDASVLQCTSRTPDDLMWQSAGVSYQRFASSENGRLYLRLVAR